MVRYSKHPSSHEEGSKSFNLISSYNLIEVEDGNGSYTRIIKDSEEDFEKDLKKNLERKVNEESTKTKLHKSSKRK